MIEQLGRDHFDQFVRITVELSKLPVESIDELVHGLIGSLALGQEFYQCANVKTNQSATHR